MARRPFLLLSLVCASIAFIAASACSSRRGFFAERRAAPSIERFLKEYNDSYRQLTTAANEANWALNTHIVEGDSTNKERVEAAEGALAVFVGSTDLLREVDQYLGDRKSLDYLQARQLEAIRFRAAQSPEAAAEVVAERIAAEAAQTETLFGYQFEVAGVELTANDIDRTLRTSESEAERLATWNASKEVGKELKEGLVRLVDLRNRSVQPLGYPNYFAYQVSEYGIETAEMMELMQRFLRDLRPLYRELHTFARYELAKRFGRPVPKEIPAHWLPNRWGQEWRALVKTEGLDIDARLAKESPSWLVEQAEAFYVSLGFEKLPPIFWEKSSLYPLPADAEYKKNNHASAWHVDLDRDVRSLMSVESDSHWWETTHHELGHIYYFLEYSRPEVPTILREGANRAFHEAIGSLLGFASMHREFLVGRELLEKDAAFDDTGALLEQALDTIVFMPFSCGTMTHFERDLYEGLSPDEYNARWWAHVRRFQGIVPPAGPGDNAEEEKSAASGAAEIDGAAKPLRGEEYCDAATKTHINDDAAQYYDYAISYVLLHQLHDHIARKILRADPRNTNYYGNEEVGRFLREILRLGATRDWREVLRDAVGSELSTRPMLEYFAPLEEHLRGLNEGREPSELEAI